MFHDLKAGYHYLAGELGAWYHGAMRDLSVGYHDLMTWYLASLDSGGYPLIVLLMALESSIVPLPSELVIPPAVYVAVTKGTMSLPGIVVAGAVGSWLGASLMYGAAVIAGRPLIMRVAGFVARLPYLRRYAHFLLITPEKIEMAERWSSRFGSYGVFASRMLPVIRHLIGIPAGIVRMSFLKFSVYTLLGSAFWCSVLTFVAVQAGKNKALMNGELHAITLWLAGAIVVLGAIYYFLVYRMTRRKGP
jgi:membrane protein DedA with SNARE-associated domain